MFGGDIMMLPERKGNRMESIVDTSRAEKEFGWKAGAYRAGLHRIAEEPKREMKRVLIFSLAYQPFVGGAELAIQEITGRISPGEYSFDLITLRFDRNLPRVEKIGNVTVYRIGFCRAGAKVSDRSMPLVCKVAKIFFRLHVISSRRSRSTARITYDLVWAMHRQSGGIRRRFFSN